MVLIQKELCKFQSYYKNKRDYLTVNCQNSSVLVTISLSAIQRNSRIKENQKNIQRPKGI